MYSGDQKWTTCLRIKRYVCRLGIICPAHPRGRDLGGFSVSINHEGTKTSPIVRAQFLSGLRCFNQLSPSAGGCFGPGLALIQVRKGNNYNAISHNVRDGQTFALWLLKGRIGLLVCGVHYL